MSVYLQTFGSLAVVGRDGVMTSLSAQPVRAALLVYIAVERETTRNAVTALLWPDRDDQRARHLLSQTLYQLRRDLGEGLILAERERLCADALLRVDTMEFTAAVEAGRAEDAVALYRGPFLAGQRLADANDFERWVDLQRARLERMHRRVRRQLIRDRIEAGDRHGALDAARAWADFDPFEDEAQHQVIAQLAEAGELDEALNRYAMYARQLSEEDLTPLDETTALIENIRVQRAGARAGTHRPDENTGGDAVTDAISTTAIGRAGSGDGPAGPSPALIRVGGDEEAPDPPLRLARFRRSTLGAVLAVVAAAAGVVGLLSRRSRDVLTENRVLVVPFDNETGDSTLAPVGLLAADWIAQGLANMGPLQVVPTIGQTTGPRGESGSTPATGLPAALSAARTAGAGLVVSGRYYRRADVLEVYAQVSEVGSGRMIAAPDPVMTAISSPGVAIDDVRQIVMGLLAARFAARVPLEDPSVSHPPTYESFLAFRQGADLFIRGENARAIPHLLRATALDSQFVRPLLLAASAYSNMNDLAREDSMLEVVARRSATLAPYERAHLEYARAGLRGDLDAQHAAGQEIARLAPGGPAHYVVARLSLWIGRPREAIDMLASLPPEREWMPVWWNTWTYITGAYHALELHRRELRQIRAVLRHDSRLRMRVLELRALAALGRVDELLERLDSAAAAPADPALSFGSVLAQTASELREHGHDDAGRAVLERAVQWYEDPQNRRTPQQQWERAQLLGNSGRYDEAETILTVLRSTDPARIDYFGYGGILAAMSGDSARAIAIGDSLSRLETPYMLGRNTYWRAAIHAHVGQIDDAIRLLQEARQQGQPIGFQLHADENLWPLRDKPQYRALFANN